MDYLLDTSLLVGLWRGAASGLEARFLDRDDVGALSLPWVAEAEFLTGSVIARHDLSRVHRFMDQFPLVWPDQLIGMRYARAYAGLRAAKLTVGANDLWVAATALERGLPVPTRNVREFSRVDGLRVIDDAAA